MTQEFTIKVTNFSIPDFFLTLESGPGLAKNLQLLNIKPNQRIAEEEDSQDQENEISLPYHF